MKESVHVQSPQLDESRWFAEEVQPHEPALRAYLRGRFPTLRDVDDLVHDAYLRLMSIRSTDRVGHTKAYLFITARNAALDRFRRDKVVPVIGISELAEQAMIEERPDAAELASRDQELEMLSEAIRSLPERCRLIFSMRKLLGLSHREIAKRLSISERTVNAQIAIGVARCRYYFRLRGDGDGCRYHGTHTMSAAGWPPTAARGVYPAEHFHQKTA
ncbi:MAG TPA: sigma-70 family RNA polymerase sigma factor [Opitutaceae bacterium]